jgi:hypothetical protein
VFRQGNLSSETQGALSDYSMYQAVARMKLIQFENDRDDSEDFSPTDDVFPLAQNGVPKHLRVSLTSEGEKVATIHKIKNSDLRLAVFQCGEYRIDKITSNKPLQIYGEKYGNYRAVLGTHIFESNPEFREVCRKHSEAGIRERRFRTVLKHDPIPDTWNLEASDVGPREFDFESSNVPLLVAKLRADRRFVKQ